jgi:hypothetical protein
LTAKHALLIGINKYPHYSEDMQLAGCVNDAKRMKLVLVDHFKFDADKICELHDEAATRETILGEMERLVEVVQEDDIVVFHYSGHGRRREARLRKNTKLRPTDGEWFDKAEGSGFDSTLMPSNTGPRPHPHLDITDNTIHNWLERLTAITSNVTLIFDSCHSGTVTRGGDGVKIRTVTADDRTPLELAESTPGPEMINAVTKAKKGKSGWLPLSNRYTLIAGSRDSETSKEMDVSSDSPFGRHGALSYHLTNALLDAVPGTTHRDVFEIAGGNVTAWFNTQHPQIEGALDREIFGEREIQPMRFIPVLSVDGDTAVLGGGSIHGLGEGSVWDIYPQGAKQSQGTIALGSMDVERVGPLTSQARIVSHSDEISTNCRCVERANDAGADALQIDNAASSLDVEFNIFRVASDNELEPANDAGFEFSEGERLAFEVVNNEDHAIFVSILHFGLNGAIKLLYPRRKSSEMIAGALKIVKGAGRAKLRVNLDGFDGEKATLSYKAFVATQPIDLAWLCRGATTAELVTSAPRPKQLSARRAARATRSAADNEKLLNGPDDWLAITRSIAVKRSAR